MSGQAGIRGYLLQTLVGVLDALRTDRAWTTLTLEPGGAHEKADIAFHYAKKVHAIQVRSSENQVSKALLHRWAKEFEDHVAADSHELVLLGPVAASVASAKRVGKVRIPTPKPLDEVALVQQAAHSLNLYLGTKAVTSPSAQVLELLTHVLVARFASYSTSGKAIARGAFDEMLLEWLVQLLPLADGTGLAKRYLKHDISLFKKLDAALSEQQLTEFLTHVSTHHAYLRSMSSRVARLERLLSEEGNRYLYAILDEVTAKLAQAIGTLLVFMAKNFFWFPDDQRSDDPQLCLYPEGNVDRAAYVERNEERRYNRLSKELNTLVVVLDDAYRAYRRAVAQKLAV